MPGRRRTLARVYGGIFPVVSTMHEELYPVFPNAGVWSSKGTAENESSALTYRGNCHGFFYAHGPCLISPEQ